MKKLGTYGMAASDVASISVGGLKTSASQFLRYLASRDRVPTQNAAERKNLLLLIQLRWLAVAGQIATITVVSTVFGIDLPLPQMAAVVLFLVALNIFVLVRFSHQSRVTNIELFIELLFDVAALTVQLYLSGGGTNPFISLYLLQVILGAVLLETWPSWMIVVITSCCYLWLTKSYCPISFPHHSGDFFNLHLHGMFVCFLLAAILVVFFIGQINRNLRERDANLAKLRQQAAEEDHIVRMGLLASGAAHELGTPLATLSVLLNDWQRMPFLANDSELAHDIGEMQDQVARCKGIVSNILLSAGEARGEGTVRTTVNAFLDRAVEEWRASRSPIALKYTNACGPDEPIVADVALKQVIFNVFDNALEASPQCVEISAQRVESNLIILVDDRGPGFTHEILAELGLPYRSTKKRAGSGLGLFLVFNVVRKLGGRVVARNRCGGGATVELVLPLAPLSAGGDCGR